MSGGSMNYFYEQIEYGTPFKENTVLRRAMRTHLGKVAAALHAIEWNDSGDGADDEEQLIRACISPTAELEQAREDAKKAAADLKRAIATADKLFSVWGYKREGDI